MAKCTTRVVRTHTEWVKCPKCQMVSRGWVWHKRPRVYHFQCILCFHRIENENGVRPWVAQDNPVIPF